MSSGESFGAQTWVDPQEATGLHGRREAGLVDVEWWQSSVSSDSVSAVLS